MYYFTGLAGIFRKVVDVYKTQLSETGRSHLSLADFLALCGHYILSFTKFTKLMKFTGLLLISIHAKIHKIIQFNWNSNAILLMLSQRN